MSFLHFPHCGRIAVVRCSAIQEISSRSWIGCLTLKARDRSSTCNNILVDCKCLILLLHAVHIVQHVLLHKLELLVLGAHYLLLGLPQ